MMKFGLKKETVEKLVAVIAKAGSVKKAVIFGSRARGDYSYNSDIDIALFTDGETYAGFYTDLDEAAGIYKTNIVNMNSLCNEELRQNIESDGKEIYIKPKALA